MADKVSRRIPDDLVEVPDAQYAPLEGLAPGGAEAQERQRQAVQQSGLPLEVRTAKTGIVFRLIPAGSFMMGSPASEGERRPDERQHHVTLTKAFYCGKFEVTQGQWEQVMGSNPSCFVNAGKDAPVEQVSWRDCQAFTEKLCQLEGVPEWTYRLLTEAEWEYACRAGTQTPFCYGNDLDSGMANFDGYHPHGNEREGEARRTTVRVGGFRPNGWGLHDMHGNVQEWCLDWYGIYLSGVVTDPLNPALGVPSLWVTRGGDWYGVAKYCRSAERACIPPDVRYSVLGLRLARTTLDFAQERTRQSPPTSHVVAPPMQPLDASQLVEEKRPAQDTAPAPSSIPESEPSVSEVRTPPADLMPVVDAGYASLAGLASGGAEAQERQRQAVQQSGLPLEVRTAKTGIVFRLIPAGSFMMGSPPSESLRDDDEVQHQVTLTRAFYCGKFEVTQDQWEQVMGSNPSHFKSAGREAPVEQVSWPDCQTFTKKLCQLEGVPEWTYRLLTEAEWEYACRAGTQTAVCYGNDLDSSMANFDGNEPYVSGRKAAYRGLWGKFQIGDAGPDAGGHKGEYRRSTVRVGSFRPNAWGLYDMHGNVQEWCLDWYGSYSSGVATDPVGSASPVLPLSVVRGGGWSDVAGYCRSAERGWIPPDSRYDVLGLRLARTIP